MSLKINENEANEMTSTIPFGTRLQTARKNRNLSAKDIASQLRLNEAIILMIEEGSYPSTTPAIFLKGYLRSYAKLMGFTDEETLPELEKIVDKPTQKNILSLESKDESYVTTSYFIPFFTYLILFTLSALLGVWWYSHHFPDRVFYKTKQDAAKIMTPLTKKESSPPPQPNPDTTESYTLSTGQYTSIQPLQSALKRQVLINEEDNYFDEDIAS